ncbi:SGNH/GDSL hydrolase family protein [Nocardioides aestuarii]|uniref:SGNH/GDSL hydrolase family protein n=1 Tax=Nocardioides aestuarii TaxID=252231 RepID=A0ABW4TFL6_9ACTN
MTPRLLVVAALAGLLTACSAGSAAPDPARAPAAPTTSATAEAPTGPRLDYVAIGDSFTAAPGLPGSSLPCLRSEENYPSLVADDLGSRFRVRLDDRSCVGADTASVTSAQELGGGRIPPQAGALDRRTDLVTLSLGGNDDGFFVRLLTGCLGLGASADDAPCEVAPLVESLTGVQDRLVAAVDDVRRRAPDAEVVVVGYPQIVPKRGTCEGLPDDPAARSVARQANQALVDTVAGAAAEAGVTYVDLARASRGHELCSDDPWVNGAGSDPSGAIPFHPLPAGQRAVADLVVEAVRG